MFTNLNITSSHEYTFVKTYELIFVSHVGFALVNCFQERRPSGEL